MNTVVKALSGEQLIHGSSLATVTTNSIVFRNSPDQTLVILSLAVLTGVEKRTASNPEFLTIAAGLLILSAGAYCSPHRDSTYIPLGLLSLLFLLAYRNTRSAALAFRFGRDLYHTRQGRLPEAAAVIEALTRRQTFDQAPSESPVGPKPLSPSQGYRPRLLWIAKAGEIVWESRDAVRVRQEGAAGERSG